MSEAWKAVPGWPYEVSDQGRVRSVGGRKGAIAGRILRPQAARSRGGGIYETVTLRDYPRNWMVKVHTLVLTVFVGPRPTPAHQSNHRNGQKRDNRVSNLEWATGSENMRHAFATGLNPAAPHNVKVGAENVPLIRQRHANGESTRSLATEFGVDISTIQLMVSRKTWKHIA